MMKEFTGGLREPPTSLPIIPSLKTLCLWTTSVDGIASETSDDGRCLSEQEDVA